MKKTLTLLLTMTIVLSFCLFSCDHIGSGIEIGAESENGTVSPNVPSDVPKETVKITEKDRTVDHGEAQVLDFSKGITSSTGVEVNGDEIRITEPGEYILTGKSESYRLSVELSERDDVHLIFAGLFLSSSVSAPISVLSATKVVVTLEEGTENELNDLRPAVKENEEAAEPNAAFWSKEDLTVNGTGSLKVGGGFDAGILSKDVLKLLGGHISVESSGAGIKGKDALLVQDAVIDVTSGGDGMKSTEDEKEGSGIVQILSGTMTLKTSGDGISASKSAMIAGGTLSITAGKYSAPKSGSDGRGFGGWDRGSSSSSSESASTKGIKSDGDLLVSDGEITVVSEDDSLHCAGTLSVTGGKLTLTSGDDGMHSDDTVSLDGGEIEILNSYEGIEGKTILLRGGRAAVRAADDGINASAGSEGGGMGGFFGRGSSGSGESIEVTGGFWYLNADGDGFDSNDKMSMSGGTLLICGPTNSGNGAIDYENSFDFSGGLLVACGSTGMAMMPSASSSQCSVMISASLGAGQGFSLSDEDGKEILTFVPEKNCQNIVVSSPDLKKGSKVTVKTGVTPAGEGDCGLYSSSSGGQTLAEITLSSVNTTYGGGGNNPGGPGGPGGRDPGGRPGRW